MAGLTLTTDERLDRCEQNCRDLSFELDVERVKRWEFENQLQALQRRKIELADLPLAQLLRKLELVGNLDASLLLQPGTITPELLAPNVVVT